MPAVDAQHILPPVVLALKKRAHALELQYKPCGAFGHARDHRLVVEPRAALKRVFDVNITAVARLFPPVVDGRDGPGALIGRAERWIFPLLPERRSRSALCAS
jgi:hypothetical protein